jgi:hypothetical protein
MPVWPLVRLRLDLSDEILKCCSGLRVSSAPDSDRIADIPDRQLCAKSGHRRRTSEMSAFSESGHLLRNCRHVSDTSIRIAFSAHGPHIRFALRYGLVHARASAGVRNSAPGEVGPLSTRCASATALGAYSLQREEVRVGSTPIIMSSAILVEHHSETNAGTFIAAVTKLVQPLALTGHSVLRLNR